MFMPHFPNWAHKSHISKSHGWPTVSENLSTTTNFLMRTSSDQEAMESANSPHTFVNATMSADIGITGPQAHQLRKSQVERMLLAPRHMGGAGLDIAAAANELRQAEETACRVLYQQDRDPAVVSHEFFELIVWQQISERVGKYPYSW